MKIPLGKRYRLWLGSKIDISSTHKTDCMFFKWLWCSNIGGVDSKLPHVSVVIGLEDRKYFDAHPDKPRSALLVDKIIHSKYTAPLYALVRVVAPVVSFFIVLYAGIILAAIIAAVFAVIFGL